jgi:intracellular sulfur oxidation DsrE/DsrF family protein
MKMKWLRIFLVMIILSTAFAFVFPTTAMAARDGGGGFNLDVKAEPALHIDIPANVAAANVVFNIGYPAMNGDMPISIGHLQLLQTDFSDLNTKGTIIAVFHTDAGYMLLNDAAYNAERHVSTGNPYKDYLVDLMNKGVQIEECGATAKANNWVNYDLIPGVKVNQDAMVRLTQLGEEGYVQITEAN